MNFYLLYLMEAIPPRLHPWLDTALPELARIVQQTLDDYADWDQWTDRPPKMGPVELALLHAEKHPARVQVYVPTGKKPPPTLAERYPSTHKWVVKELERRDGKVPSTRHWEDSVPGILRELQACEDIPLWFLMASLFQCVLELQNAVYANLRRQHPDRAELLDSAYADRKKARARYWRLIQTRYLPQQAEPKMKALIDELLFGTEALAQASGNPDWKKFRAAALEALAKGLRVAVYRYRWENQ